MKNKTTNPTVIIKCKFSNDIHKILEPNLGIKKSERWKFRDKNKFTDAQKIEMFDQIMALHSSCSSELTNYQFEKRNKKRIHVARVARGYNFKKKTKKDDYLNNLQKVA